MMVKVLAVVAFFFSVYLSCSRGQCPLIRGSELGRTDTASTEGLISEAFTVQAGDNPTSPSVLLFGYNIVCLTTAGTRGTYSFVSVVANFSCTGSQSECNGEPLLSQIEFECSGSQWIPGIQGSTDNIRTTPADGTLSTPVRTNCSICISPVRVSSANNENHCSPCNNACDVGLGFCTNFMSSGCCSFFQNDNCVSECSSGSEPDSNNTCVAVVNCENLTDPSNGRVVLMERTVGSEATYDCNEGFNLEGNETRTCQSDGLWSENEPTCEAVDCGSLNDPEDGNVNLLNGTVFQSEATYSCNENFTLSENTTRICQSSGQWSGSEPTCGAIAIRVDCETLNNLNDGEVTLTGTTIGDTATYTCNTGFRIRNNTPNVRTCQDSGQWSGDEPACEANPGSPGGLSTPVIVGIVVGIVLFLILLLIVIVLVGYLLHKRQHYHV